MLKQKITWLTFVFCFCFAISAWAVSLKDAQKEYLSGNYEKAILKARRLRENDQTLYFLGLVYTKTGDHERARTYLRKLIKRYPESALHDPAMMKLADTYFLDKDYSEAKQLYQEIEKRCPQLENKSLLLLRQVQIASRQGNWEDKAKFIKLIKEKYPDSPEIAFVKLLESYGDFFTVQVGAFTEEKNARALREELIAKGYKVFLVDESKGSYSLHKVRVGRYKDRYEATKVSAKLLDQGYPARIYP